MRSIEHLISRGSEIWKFVVVQNFLHQFLEGDFESGDDDVLDEVDDEVVELVEGEVEDVEIAVELGGDFAQIDDAKAQQSRLGTLRDGLNDFERDSDGFHEDLDAEGGADVHELGGGLVASGEVIDADRGAHGHVSRVLVHGSQSGSVDGAESLQDANAEVLQNRIGELVGVSVVDVDDV